MPAKDKLERHDLKGSTKDGSHLGRCGGSSPQQTRMSPECGQCVHMVMCLIKVTVKVIFLVYFLYVFKCFIFYVIRAAILCNK